MKVNNMALRRWSTYANFTSMIVSAALVGLPDIGLDAFVVARIMLVGNIIIASCQFVKQQEATKD